MSEILIKTFGKTFARRLAALGLIGVMLLTSLAAQALPQGDAIRDSRTILRQALPISEPSLPLLDSALAKIGLDLKYNRWSPSQADVSKARGILDRQSPMLLAQLQDEKKQNAQADFDQLKQQLDQLNTLIGKKIKGKDEAEAVQNQMLATLDRLEQNWLGSFPYSIPADYSQLPQLLGRANVELTTSAGSMIITLDGYSAPVTAGNFADLVKKGFYDGIDFSRVEDLYVIQAGDPPGPAEGYIDPKTKKLRTIPLEIRVKNEIIPRYGKTFEELGIWDAEPVLPFNAVGTVAMARAEDPNSGSSQFFIFLAEPDLTPAGLNLMDGRYAAFGYITEGKEVMKKIKKGDKILKARLITGAENLKS